KVTWDKNENLTEVSSKFYKFDLNQTEWLTSSIRIEKEMMTALEVMDLFSSENFKEQLSNPLTAQRLYAYYFEATADLLKKGDSMELDLWKARIKSVPKLIETIPTPSPEDALEHPKMKLLQNFMDLTDALENNNLEYFGISTTTTI